MKRFEDRMDLDGKKGKMHRCFRDMDRGRVPCNPLTIHKHPKQKQLIILEVLA